MSSSAISYKEAIPLGLGQREQNPRSMRWPKDLVLAVQRIAESKNQDFSTAALYILRAGITEYDRRETRKPARRAS